MLFLVGWARLAFSLYYVLSTAVLVTLGMFVAGLVSLPFGVRRAMQNIYIMSKVFINALAAWTFCIAPSRFVVTLDEQSLSRASLADTMAQLAIAFGIGSGKSDAAAAPVHREIVIANHQIYSDWLYIWAFMNRIGRAGYVKFVMKRALQFLPILGQGMKMQGYIFLHRNWALDQIKFARRIQRLGARGLPYNLLVFPEGTTYTERARLKGQAYAKEKGLPVLENVLLPRSTGMYAALKGLTAFEDPSYRAAGILDLTVGYSGLPPAAIPELFYTLSSLFRDGHAPEHIHINAAYIPVSEIPLATQEDFTVWLADRYKRKDAMLEQFRRTGRFTGIASAPAPLAPKEAYTYFWLCLFLFHALVALVVVLVLKLTRVF